MRWLRVFFSGWLRPRSLGERGERWAAQLVKSKGHRVLYSGRRNRYGELDLITVDERRPGRPVVFVEVKTRRDTRGGAPAESVTAEKQRRLTRAATEFLRANDLLDHPTRFDVVSIVWPPAKRRPDSVEHFENAFEARG